MKINYCQSTCTYIFIQNLVQRGEGVYANTIMCVYVCRSSMFVIGIAISICIYKHLGALSMYTLQSFGCALTLPLVNQSFVALFFLEEVLGSIIPWLYRVQAIKPENEAMS